MAIPQDVTLGLVAESTYKTYVAPTAFYEVTDENIDWDKIIAQGMGLRVGRRTDRADRRVLIGGQGVGDITIEAIAKGMGKILQAALGTGVSTTIVSPAFMQNFTLGDAPSSLTVQKGSPEAGGTVDAFSALGCMVADWELAVPNNAIATFKANLDVGDYSTAQSLATASYPASANLLHFGNSAWTTGAFTPGTTTTLATCATTMLDVRSFTLSGKNNLINDRFNGGGLGRKLKPLMGKRDITGTIDIEYDATTFRDAMLAETTTALVVKLTGSAVGASTETLQVNLPTCKFDKGVPNSNGDKLIVVSYPFTVLEDPAGTNPTVQFQYITGDTTI